MGHVRDSLPLHLTWAPQVRANLRSFAAAFQEYYPRGNIRYAVKASCHRALLRVVDEEGCGADVTSPFEVRCSLEAGMDPRRLDVNGNCKEESLIAQAIGEDMLLVADSFEELALIDGAARALGRRPRVVLRVSGFELGPITGTPTSTAGKWSKFGVAATDVPSFLQCIVPFDAIDLLGFQAHIGSQIASPAPYLVVLG